MSDKQYEFYGWEQADCPAVTDQYPGIRTPQDLYDALCELWAADTCAPRMRQNWTKKNRTLGQCSITAFLVQDIFGGEVRGILRPGGNYHCYNVIGEKEFDLTSEQFTTQGETLDYSINRIQTREEHFSKEEKYERYLLLSSRLLNYCKSRLY